MSLKIIENLNLEFLGLCFDGRIIESCEKVFLLLPEQRPLGQVWAEGREEVLFVIAEQEVEDSEGQSKPGQTTQKVAFHSGRLKDKQLQRRTEIYWKTEKKQMKKVKVQCRLYSFIDVFSDLFLFHNFFNFDFWILCCTRPAGIGFKLWTSEIDGWLEKFTINI